MSKQDGEKSFKDYRKKPLVVQAKQMEKAFTVETLEGVMEGQAGDYLIIGVAGETYPCQKEVFENSYDPAEHDPPRIIDITHEAVMLAGNWFLKYCSVCGKAIGYVHGESITYGHVCLSCAVRFGEEVSPQQE